MAGNAQHYVPDPLVHYSKYYPEVMFLTAPNDQKKITCAIVIKAGDTRASIMAAMWNAYVTWHKTNDELPTPQETT